MKKNVILTALLLTTPNLTKGQTLCEVWTMDDCIRYAVAHSANVQKRTVEAASARTDVAIALSDFLPSVAASTSVQYSWGRNVDPETNTYNTVTTFNNYYNVYATLPLFDGGQTINRFRQARLMRRQGQTALQQAQDDTAIDVMQKYVDAVYVQQCVDLATEKLAESRRLLYQTQRMEELGMKGYPDVAQIESQVAEDDYGLTHQQNLCQSAMLALKTAMNYPSDSSAFMVDGLSTQGSPQGDRHSCLLSPVSCLLPAAVIAEQSVRRAELDYHIAQGRLLPSLSLTAGVSTSYFRNLTGGGTASPFHTQFSDNMGEYVYATLSLPLFELARYKNVRKARHNVRLAEIGRDETLRRLSDETLQARMDCEGYAKEVVKMERKVASDSLSYHLSQRKYEEGMLSTFDLHTASQTLLESRVRLLQTQMLYAIKQKLVMYYQSGHFVFN